MAETRSPSLSATAVLLLLLMAGAMVNVTADCGGAPGSTSLGSPNPECSGGHCGAFGVPPTSPKAGSCSRLGIGVLSTSAHAVHRTVIRESWGAAIGPGVVLKFVVARPADPAARERLALESGHYEDMVLVDSFEAYSRTVWQMLELYRYFSALGCPWVAKVDDDVYLRVPRVLGFLGEQRSAGSLAAAGRDSLLWVGHMEAAAKPLRTGKWKVSETVWPIAQGSYPTFGGGPAHLMSHGLASLISATSRRANCENTIRWFPLEDVAIGIWIDKLKTAHHDIEMVNNRRFFVFRHCHENAFNTLLERGQPLFVDPNVTMLQMVENEQKAILGGRGRTFCPTGTTAADARSNGEASAGWSALSEQIEGRFARRLPGMIAEWRASATAAATAGSAGAGAAAAGSSPAVPKGGTGTAASAAAEKVGGGVRCDHRSGVVAGAECVGATVEVYWADDRLWYRATVLWFGAKRSLHMVRYEDDGLIEKINLALEPWRVTGQAQAQPSSATVADVDAEGVSTAAGTPAPSSDEAIPCQPGQAASASESATPCARRTGSLRGAQELEGKEIEVYWPDDDAWYAGTVQWFDTQRQMHLLRYAVDDLFEKVDLRHERVRMGGKEYGWPSDDLSAGGPVSADSVAAATSNTPPPAPPAPPPSPPPSLPPSPPPSSLAKKIVATKAGATEILVIVPGRMADWHAYLAGEGKVKGCAVDCRISYDDGERGRAHAVVYLGDDELYSGRAHILPPKPASNPNLQYLGIIREYIPVFPDGLWDKYDGRITYSTDVDSEVCYNYAAPWVLEAAKSTPTFEERSTEGRELVGFVSRQCVTDRRAFAKNVSNPWDGRANRTRFAEALQKLGSKYVASYGRCVNNKQWPLRHSKDKGHAMKQHLFCIAMENSRGTDYVTEKLWDCLEAGAVPLYLGAPNILDYLPFGRRSAIFIDDFKDIDALAAHLNKVAADKALWESYRPWFAEEPSPQWLSFMKRVSMKEAKCNLCKYLDNRREKSVPANVLCDTADDSAGTADTAAKTAMVEGDAVGRAVVAQWSVQAVGSWLESKGFGSDWVRTFAANYVDGKLLLEIDDQMLSEDLSMSSKLHRKRFLLAVGGMKG